jgi:hypothetical protein
MIEPRGVSIHDPETDELLDMREWTVLHRGRARVLRLRVARGDLRETGEDARAGPDPRDTGE